MNSLQQLIKIQGTLIKYEKMLLDQKNKIPEEVKKMLEDIVQNAALTEEEVSDVAIKKMDASCLRAYCFDLKQRNEHLQKELKAESTFSNLSKYFNDSESHDLRIICKKQAHNEPLSIDEQHLLKKKSINIVSAPELAARKKELAILGGIKLKQN